MVSLRYNKALADNIWKALSNIFHTNVISYSTDRVTRKSPPVFIQIKAGDTQSL